MPDDFYTFTIRADGGSEERQGHETEHAYVEIASTAFVCLSHMVDGQVVPIEPAPELDREGVFAAQRWAAGILARLHLAVRPEVEYMGQLHKCDQRKVYFRWPEKPELTGDRMLDALRLANAGTLSYEGGDGCSMSAELNPGQRVDDPPFMTLWVPSNRTRRASALLADELGKLMDEEGA